MLRMGIPDETKKVGVKSLNKKYGRQPGLWKRMLSSNENNDKED